MSDIKKLMGDAISEETAEKLQQILDESLKSKDDEIESLKEKLKDVTSEVQTLKEEHEQDIKFLTEKADEYNDQSVEDLKESFAKREAFLIEKAEEYGTFLIEQGEAYGEFLIEKADQYGDFLQEKAEAYGEHLIEQADQYGDFLQEKAEAYGEHLIEQADAYGEMIEEKCLIESKEQIEEFKSHHLEEFARLDEHTRMSNVFNNLKSLIEASGFTIEETDALEESVAKSRRLSRKLRDTEAELKKYKVAELIENYSDEVTFKDKERIVNTVLMTRCSNDEEMSDVVKTLVESTLNKHVDKNTNALNENYHANKKQSRRII